MDFRLPELGEGVYEAEVVRWLVEPGDTVKRGQALIEVLTDKATMEVSTPFAGVIETFNAEPGERIKVGDVILTYNDATASTGTVPIRAGSVNDGLAATAVATAPAARPGNGPMATPAQVKAAPSVRQLAHKLGIDLGSVVGSGPHGRILVDDLTSLIQRTVAAPAPAAPPAEKKMPVFDYGKPGTKQKFQGLRRIIAEHMSLATRTSAHTTYIDECDVTDLVKMRESLRHGLAGKGLKLTYMPFFVKAVIGALKEVPIVNSSLDEEAGEITLHDQYNIGMAVATPGGLIVPVIHRADRLSVLEIAREAARISGEARTGKSKLDDLRGGTFTITSIGNLGGLFSTPIIHQPQVGILGIGKIVKRPVFDEHDQIRAAHMAYLSLTFDHRVIDGDVGIVFGNAIIRRLQNPASLLIED